VLLEPLDERACTRLIDNLLEAEAGAGLKQRIARAAEGNPLFVEEMLSMLIDDGTLQRDNGRWIPTRDVAEIDVPPTIQALLAARLDRLTGEERTVLEHAAVAGKLFSRGAVRALAGADVPAALDDRLGALVRKQLIEPHRAVFAGEDTFRFRHVLIRDAAYQTMPKDMRAHLHERFGTWLEERAGASGPEIEEIIGYHFEQAHRFRAELHAGDDAARTLALRGAARLASAGRRAFGRNDMPAAVGLLTRASLLLRDDDELRIELAPDLGKALRETGQIERADGVLARAIENAAAAGNRRVEALARVEQSILLRQGDRTRDGEEARRTAEAAIAVFEELGDSLGIAKALELIALEHWIHCRYAAMEAVLEEALEHARSDGDTRQVASILNALARAALLGPRPVEEALRRCERMRTEVEGDRNLDAVLDAIVAVLEAQRGHFPQARELCARSRESFEDLGLELQLVSLHTYAGLVELLAGDPAAAERELKQGYQALERMGERGRLSTATAFLARAHYEQGSLDEAERYTTITENSASPDDVVSQTVWRQTRARILADRGKTREALKLAREAVALADETDYATLRGDALLALAEVLRAAGEEPEAGESAAEALRLYEAKGDIVSAARARAFPVAHLDPARVKQ
jgi:tetratricopeptide (TPR) repeat protein